MSSGAAFRSTPEEKPHEDVVVPFVNLHAVVIDRAGADQFINLREIASHGLAVIACDERWIGKHRLSAFHVDEACWAIKVEVELPLIEQMKDGDVVTAEAQVL